ncbi:MAG: T9SS type A sorting domain-containing protein [Bacteroidales bacterium]|nr:T9SS type A sorting domain-containing protein [Bacteroidales bacterium]
MVFLSDILKIKGIGTDFKTEIIGVDGKIYIHSNNNKLIDIKCLKSGVYIVKIYSDNNIVFHKIIKQ